LQRTRLSGGLGSGERSVWGKTYGRWRWRLHGSIDAREGIAGKVAAAIENEGFKVLKTKIGCRKNEEQLDLSKRREKIGV
jgi:hypothetical protein